jgi:hypothetical protein
MRNIHIYVVLLLAMFLLIGCKSSVSDLKEAVSGIHTQAEKAKSGLTIDAYTLREYEIEYKDELFTVDELFKTILRDVQWEYEKNQNQHQLLIKGTWKEPLFDYLQLSDEVKEELATTGKILITLTFEEDQLVPGETTVTMKLKEDTLVDEKGEDILHYFYDIYLGEKM